MELKPGYLCPPGYKQTEVGLIPEEWKQKRLCELGRVVRGGSPRPAGDPRYFDGQFIPWLTVAALTNIPEHQLRVTDTAGFLTEEGAKHSRTLQRGTLIIANSGATLGIAKVLNVTCCANDGIAAIVKQTAGDKEFVCYYINSRTKHLREVVATGNGQPNLNTTLIREMPIPFPPPAEQRAIAGVLSDVDALIGGLDQLIAKKRDLKQATVQQLLTGQTRLPGFHGKWEVKRLGDVAALNRLNVTPASLPTQMFVHFSLPAFDVGKVPVTEPGSAIGSNKFRVPQGAVLVSKLNPRIPRIWAPDDIPLEAIASTEFLVLTPREGTSRRFLFVLCSSPLFCEQMELAATGTTGSHQRISPGGALSLKVPVPVDVEEQTAIAEVLSDMDAELEALEQRRDKTRALKQGMMQELLTGRTRLV